MEIKNIDKIRDDLFEMLKQYDIDRNEYQTDVYAYVEEIEGEDACTVSLHEFVNVGGNSWLNDDHITIYSDSQHTESSLDFAFPEVEDLLNFWDGMTEEQLKILVFEDLFGCKFNPDEHDLGYIDYHEMFEYTYKHKGEEMEQEYADSLDDYSQEVDEIIECLEEEIERRFS